MKMEPIEGSETSVIINQTPGNYPKENLLYTGYSFQTLMELEFPRKIFEKKIQISDFMNLV